MSDDALRNVNIVVCTHKVLLDALIHGFVHMDKIAPLVFDEAHHCVRGHPANKIMQILRIGTCVGTSNYYARASNIGDLINVIDQKETLDDLRNGTKYLIIATNIYEKGVDVAAYNVVICFEPPRNLKSFIQRRGRARSAKSIYVILFPKRQEKTHLK